MIVYLLIVVFGILSRLMPHEWNVAPVTAIAIFSAIYLSKKEAIVLPLVIRFISDVLIGFFSWPLMISVYVAHLFGVMMGLWVKKQKNVVRVITAPLVSGIFFFLVTNFAWLYSEYPHNVDGVILAYTNGLPFLKGTLLGDVFFTLMLVGGYETFLAIKKQKHLITA